MAHYYILKDKKVTSVDDMVEWCEFMENSDRIVKQEEIRDVRISTVFIGLDYGSPLDRNASPVVFETRVFGGSLDTEQRRYCTWEEAGEGHKEMCAEVVKSFTSRKS